MPAWPRYPTIYEINTWVWVSELRSKYGRSLNLHSVPPSEWDDLAALGFDAVWFMGVWERSPAGIAISNRNEQNVSDFRRALPDFRFEDNVGSPYCVRRYVVDSYLGGPDGLASARRELAKRGMKLLLDYVPNHVAADHPWVSEHPEYFVWGTVQDLSKEPWSYLNSSANIFACGRDPYFPAWADVLQLNAFNYGLRRASVETLSTIAEQCDGVRCDMAMLLLNSVFEQTWGKRVGPRPQTDYWSEIIPCIKLRHPRFLFIAEAYWDLEWELQQQGFDFCYDKRLYDRLEHGTPESVRLHLSADLSFQSKLLRFLENHDEPRAANVFALEREEAAAVITSTLPGARLFHEGQFEGRKTRLPVFLARRPKEPANLRLQAFYRKLLNTIERPVFHDGKWSLCERGGWPDNRSFGNILAWTWQSEEDRYLIAVNVSEWPAQARISCGWPDLGDGAWILTEPFSDAKYKRDAHDLSSNGLYVDLGPWGYHVLQCARKAGSHEVFGPNVQVHASGVRS